MTIKLISISGIINQVNRKPGILSEISDGADQPAHLNILISAFDDCRHDIIIVAVTVLLGSLWLSGRVLDSRPKGHGFEPHWHHCVLYLEQDTFSLA